MSRLPEYEQVPEEFRTVMEKCVQSLPEMKTVDELRGHIEKLYREILNVETVLVQEHAAANGYETLTTDTKGARSAEWFERTGKAFSTGNASSCIAVAVIHEDIGMGASHRNYSDVDITVDRYIRALLNPQLATNPDWMRANSSIRNPRNLDKVVAQAVNEAFEEFNGLNPVFPQRNTVVAVCGSSELEPPLIKRLRRLVASTIETQPLRGVGTEIRYVDYSGKKGDIIYGGKNHPSFYLPSFRQTA